MVALKGIEKNWNLLFSAAGCVCAIVFGFWQLPTPDSALGSGAYVQFAKFMVAVLVAAFLPAMLKWRRKQDARRWAAGALAGLTLSVAALLAYEYTRASWIVQPWCGGGKRFVIGSDEDLLADARIYKQSNPGCQADCLVNSAACDPTMVWSDASIARHSLLLHALYVAGIPIFAVSILCASQVLSCATAKTRKAGPRARAVRPKSAA